MRHFIKNGIQAALVSLSLLTLPAISHAEKQKTQTISPQLYKQLSSTEQLIAKQHYAHARQKLHQILSGLKKDSYEQALTLSSLASVYALENNYSKAAKFLEQCLATKMLSDPQQQESLLNLGQLYMATEQYQKTVNTLQRWLNNNPETTDVQVLLANAYTQLKQYRKALPYIEKAIKQSKKPQEGWLQLNLALYYELENYSAAAGILRKLQTRYPDKKDYWQQLASIYQQLRQFSKALTTQHLAYKKGFISSESDILTLVNLFLYQKQPYQAAQLLDKELNAKRVTPNATNWEALANAWTSAREYKQAVNALEKASALHEKGELYLQLGRIHIEQELWQAAINAINKAVKKGQLKQIGEAYILLGMSLYETEQIKAAKQAFHKAAKYRKTQKSAKQWLNYIE